MQKYMIALCALMTLVPSIKCVEPAVLMAMLFAAHANEAVVVEQQVPQAKRLTKKNYKKVSYDTKIRNQPRKSKNRNHPNN